MRDLSQEKIKSIFLEGVNFDMRIKWSVEKVSVLVAIGVNQRGQRLVLAFQAGDKESASSWREFLKDLKKREGLMVEMWFLALWMDSQGWKRYLRKSFQRGGPNDASSMYHKMSLPRSPGSLKRL